jgi:DNA-binding CsgD family transcriptional regulator
MSHQRSAFVGRRRELDVFQQALHDVRTGNGRTVVVAGEPGIGKTRLVEQFSASLAPDEFDIMVARCESGEQAPAFWPWLQVLEPVLAAHHSVSTPGPLIDAITDLNQVLSNPDGTKPDTTRSRYQQGETRFFLFRTFLQVIQTKSASQPLVLFIDDLHRADAASLDLFAFLAGHIANFPVMLIATCRNDEQSIAGRLSATLAAVAREPGHTYLQPERLSSDEVADYIASTLSVDIRQETLAAAVTATGGNPFFMREIVWLLESSETPHGSGTAIRIPDTIRHTIGERLSQLPVATRTVLDAAAVIGHRFDLAVLAGTAGGPAVRVIQALEPAKLFGILDEVAPDTFQFSHALIRDVCYQSIPLLQRHSLHLSAGRAIERLSTGIDPPYTSLSHHFSQAASVGGAGNAVRYATLAAQEALARYAWEAAIDQCECGLSAIRLLEPSNPGVQCDLLLLLGDAQTMAGAGRETAILAGTAPIAITTYAQAARLAEQTGLPTRFARAALGVSGTILAVPQGGVDGIALLERALELLPQDQETLRAEIMARLAVDTARLWSVGALRLSTGDLPRFRERSDEAVAVARRTMNPRTLAWALTARRIAGEGTGDPDLWIQDADEVIQLGRTGNDPIILNWGLDSKYDALLESGQSTLADQVLGEVDDLTNRIDTPRLRMDIAKMRAGQAIRKGDLDAAEEYINQARALWPDTATITFQLVWLRREQQRLPEIQDRVRTRSERMPGSPLWKAIRLLSGIEAGEMASVRERWEHLFTVEYDDLPRGFLWLRSLAMLAEVAHALDDSKRAAIMYRELSPFAAQHLFIRNSDHTGGAVSMYLGLLATTREHWIDAKRCFQQALDMNERSGNLPYVAYTMHFWADMLNRWGKPDERERAHAMNQMALKSSQDMQMTRLSAMATDLANRLTPAPLPIQSMGLTEREVEVLTLLVLGRTNREIADALFVSPRTIGSHVSSILAKLGARTRTEAATAAVRHRILPDVAPETT